MKESMVEGVSENTLVCQLGSAKPDLLVISQLSLNNDCSSSFSTYGEFKLAIAF
jgi:hypothetical protein